MSHFFFVIMYSRGLKTSESLNRRRRCLTKRVKAGLGLILLALRPGRRLCLGPLALEGAVLARLRDDLVIVFAVQDGQCVQFGFESCPTAQDGELKNNTIISTLTNNNKLYLNKEIHLNSIFTLKCNQNMN